MRHEEQGRGGGVSDISEYNLFCNLKFGRMLMLHILKKYN